MEFQTRLVESRLQIELQLVDENIHDKALEEYHVITQVHNNSIEKWLSSLKTKSGDCKCGGGTLVLGEMLVQIYKKLEHIENLLSGNITKYIDLAHITYTFKLGHGIIVLCNDNITTHQTNTSDSLQDRNTMQHTLNDSTQETQLDSSKIDDSSEEKANIEKSQLECPNNALEIGKPYYARLFLPTFPARCIPIFAEALQSYVLRITKIGERDLKDYDSYIVSVEREMLKARKSDIY
ncbi:hypothetical protein CQA66_01475 [Helicobacter aurati]|uniref:Uncharacterized protein n=1 Tax=Helicobacter aurati TaxID=137778 RepID=A0A3D8J787_9HELI|nr:hypothetical protein [Helicobacter aurati]RDU73363.1 hypothetical protein CQA66_01475 [Helicobacter aurati]